MRAGTWLSILLSAAGATAARAGDVGLALGSQEAYVGVPLTVQIVVQSEQDHERPEMPDIAGAEVSYVGESRETSSNIQIGAGGRRVARTVATTKYTYRLTPTAEGQLVIPEIAVQVDGGVQRTKAATLTVRKADTGGLLYVSLVGRRNVIYVGEPLDVTLEIWLRPYNDGRISLDGNQMWDLIDKRASNWGPFLEMLQDPSVRVTVRNDRRKDDNNVERGYLVYQLNARLWPDQAGPLALEDVRIVVEYPLRIAADSLGSAFFGRLNVTQSKTLAAGVEPTAIVVKAVPTEGRPAYYRDAVGVFEFRTAARPTEVRAGDPITLSMDVTGTGRLDRLQAPSLAEMPEMVRSFQVQGDQLPGTVQGNTKRFTESIRALSAEVREIPPIPFAYFDPQKEQFVTVQSAAIPLKVQAAERMSAAQIVESGEVAANRTERLTQLQEGLEANYADPEDLLAVQALQPGPWTAGAAAFPPLAYAACALFRRRQERRAGDIAGARRRGAWRTARQRLAAGRRRELAREAAGEATGALLGYVADRLNLPAGGLVRSEALERLAQAGVGAELVERVDAVLQAGEARQFGAADESSAGELIDKVSKCIRDLEHIPF